MLSNYEFLYSLEILNSLNVGIVQKTSHHAFVYMSHVICIMYGSRYCICRWKDTASFNLPIHVQTNYTKCKSLLRVNATLLPNQL